MKETIDARGRRSPVAAKLTLARIATLAAISTFAALVAFSAPRRLAADEIDLGAVLSGTPPSVRETEKLAKQADTLILEVEKAQRQIRSTIDWYKALIQGVVPDLRRPYKQLDKEIGRCETQREIVEKRVGETKKQSDSYFRGWAGSLPLIEDDDLRGRSEERLRDSKSRFDGVLETGRLASDQYKPFLGSLRDQWTYLGHDLNPSGLDSLRPDADVLVARGRELLAQIDDGLALARAYVASIRSVQPPPAPAPPPAAPAP
ncbi:MAG: DUF2959 family protein [Thermoanaerobaculia bacterium]